MFILNSFLKMNLGKSFYKNMFEGILSERLFEGNILLAETYCYN
tara:strand:- start:1 stop:132 length:132 start_codon:yes stop_codon:yes gene_type:complete